MIYPLAGLREVQRLPDAQGGAIVLRFDRAEQSWPMFNEMIAVLTAREAGREPKG